VHIVQLLLDHGADPNIPEECAPEGRALYEACCANNLPIALLLLERGANPNAGVDSCECCLTIAEIYHGEHAKQLQELLLESGAYLPPYHMDAQQLKQAIRDNAIVVRHDEFLRCVMQNCDVELLELLLSLDPGVIASLEVGDELIYLKEPALIERLLSRGLDPTRPNWLGKTLLETCHENGNDMLLSLYSKSKTDIDIG
jgi:ankyrin repeat protein